METFYLFILIALVLLAATDLIVGVSNDAVNFLNSAIGSKVASRTTIMIIASLGIFIGATFSSGMMEIARKGVFNPEFFTFAEVMILFAAVMITDILLLDFFNTLGLPTSTTVSIVFELLGASVLLALLKVNRNAQPITEMASYINSDKALQIIGGILLSVVVAFTVGLIVQYLSRTLLTFQYEKTLRGWGSLWGGFAMSLLTYFLLVKGLKGASFVGEKTIEFLSNNGIIIIGISLVIWVGIFQLLIAFGVHILKVIVLFGTFALAMAFAGNDLVNFIGVPIAGIESYYFWKESGIAADQFTMSLLAEPVRTNTWWLLIAGLIMVATLWFSKKAQSVTETEVNLGRQSSGAERFKPTWLARKMVYLGRQSGQILEDLLPETTRRKMNLRFRYAQLPRDSNEAFDLVRASVNLTVAAALISFATSLKLPLSTTYVSFMVAMGSSLADRAWDRDSAVYRVSGVIHVIGGWFITAAVAFLASALFAYVLYKFEMYGLLILLFGVAVTLYKSLVIHRKKSEKKNRANPLLQSLEVDQQGLKTSLRKEVLDLLYHSTQIVEVGLDSLYQEEDQKIRRAFAESHRISEKGVQLNSEIFPTVKMIGSLEDKEKRHIVHLFDYYQDVAQAVENMLSSIDNHLKNSHAPFREGQVARLMTIWNGWKELVEGVELSNQGHSKERLSSLKLKKQHLLGRIEEYVEEHLKLNQTSPVGFRNHQLYLLLLQELKDLIAVTPRFARSLDAL